MNIFNKIIMGVALAAALGGCASMGTVMQREPKVTVQSVNSAKDVLGCVAPAAVEAGWTMTKFIPTKDGGIVNVSGSIWGDTPVATVTIRKSGQGSIVEVRQGASTDHVFKGVMTFITKCATTGEPESLN